MIFTFSSVKGHNKIIPLRRLNKPKNNSSTDKKKRYEFVIKEGDEFSSIRLTEGIYKDVIYQYGKVQFAKEETQNGQMPLQFQWTLKKKPEKLDLDIDKEGFIKYIGDILVEIMDERIKDGTIIDDK